MYVFITTLSLLMITFILTKPSPMTTFGKLDFKIALMHSFSVATPASVFFMSLGKNFSPRDVFLPPPPKNIPREPLPPAHDELQAAIKKAPIERLDGFQV